MTRSIPYICILSALPFFGQAQSSSPEELIRKALEASPAVAAGRQALDEAEAAARSLGSPRNPELELAPGAGFTNSNFVIGQSLDVFGTRSARTRRAKSDVDLARANLLAIRLQTAASLMEACAEYRAAVKQEVAASEQLAFAKATLDMVRKRVSIGEAPEVQATRAEIEVARAEQALAAARGRQSAARAGVNSLLGKPFDAELGAMDWRLEAKQLEDSSARRPEMAAAGARIEGARAHWIEMSRAGSPEVFAGIAADTWSLDRRPFASENLGFQVRLSMPLFDRGENRFAVRAAEAALKSRESELLSTERRIALEIKSAWTHLESARQIASGFATGVLPKAEAMLRAIQSGYQTGLTSYLEVLEALRTVAQLRREALDAERDLWLSEVRYLAAAAQFPEWEIPKR